ncbi:MAG: hypothetical protein LBV02_04950 [Bacteroidales bacterium]|jgi:gliding motility-associated lipoprotein GldD|nr:hypothetical protein [Bacteroidales bacterium]
MIKFKNYVWILGSIIFFSSCIKQEENYTPKPKGYFRIELPKHEYVQMDTDSMLPFLLQHSRHAEVNVESKEAGMYWLNVDYPSLNAQINMTYIPLHGDLRELAVAEEKMMAFHIEHGKVDDILEDYIYDPNHRIYGKIFTIEGKTAATPLTFWATDSADHFLRAALYFNFAPNNDSLKPVIDYLKDDVLEMINTLEWKR